MKHIFTMGKKKVWSNKSIYDKAEFFGKIKIKIKWLTGKGANLILNNKIISVF